METRLDKVRAYYGHFDEWGRLDSPEGVRELARALELLSESLAPGPRLSGLIGLIDRAATKPAQVRADALRMAADTGVFSNAVESGFQEGYYPFPGEMEQLFTSSGFRVDDMLSLKSIANELGPQVARLDPDVRAELERLARELCRRPEVIATSGHALLIASPR